MSKSIIIDQVSDGVIDYNRSIIIIPTHPLNRYQEKMGKSGEIEKEYQQRDFFFFLLVLYISLELRLLSVLNCLSA